MKRLLLAFLLVVAATCPALAQKTSDQVQEDTSEIKVFSLMHVPAAEARKLLTDVLGEQAGEGIAIDARRNAVIAKSTPARLEVMEALLLKLESSPAEPDEQLAVYPLQHARADAVIKIVEAVLGTLKFERNFRLGIDERTNSIVAMASPHAHGLIKSVIEKLDRKGNEEGGAIAQSIRFEVYWVAEGEGTGQLPKELERIFSEQADVLGIPKPTLLASASVVAYIDSNSPGGLISLHGIKASDGSQLDCTALITPLEDQSFKFDLRLNVGDKSKTSIQTTIRTNAGHPVFVASTTTSNESNKPTVFVLRITEQP